MSIREVHRSALIDYSPEQMFDLVADVERYPQFLPWVSTAQLHERGESHLVASMEMIRAGVHERFTTRNEFERPKQMILKLVEGPFRLLEGRWDFTPIADRGTRIALAMRFEFASPVIALLFGRAFEASCNSLVDAFVARARSVYAAPSA